MQNLKQSKHILPLLHVLLLSSLLQRPRKIGAKFTGDQIAPDEHAQPNLDFDYDGKRDRWNGYNPEEYEAVWDEYAKIEEVSTELLYRFEGSGHVSIKMYFVTINGELLIV